MMILIKAFKLILLILILSVGILFYPGSSPALEKGRGKIRGKIVNATPGASIKKSIDIILYQYLGEKEKAREELQTDPEGNFEIENLATDEGYRYFITALYKGVEYESGSIVFGKGDEILGVEIPVYEPTSDPSGISVRMHHLLIRVIRGSLQVEEYILFQNKGKKTYIGDKEIEGKNVVLEFILPPEFRDLNLLSGLMQCCIISTGKGFVDTMPIKPGAREIAFSYLIPSSSTSFELALPVQFPTENLSFLISQVKGVKLVSENLRDEGVVTLKDGNYDIFSTENLSRGAIVQAKLLGLPRKSRTFTFTLVGVIAGLVLVGVIYPLMSRNKSLSIKAPKVVIEKERYLELQKKELLLDIVELEERVSRGEIPPEEYTKLREKKKKNLVDIVKKLQEFKNKGG